MKNNRRKNTELNPKYSGHRKIQTDKGYMYSKKTTRRRCHMTDIKHLKRGPRIQLAFSTLAGVAQLVTVASRGPKGWGFNCRSGHMPRWRLWSWPELIREATHRRFSRTLSLKISKHELWVRTKKSVIGIFGIFQEEKKIIH